MRRIQNAIIVSLLIFLAGSFPKWAEAQTPYHVGIGLDMNTLITGPLFLQDGDVIILHDNDNSLKHKVINLSGGTLTIESDDSATPWTISMDNPGTPYSGDGGILQLDGGGTLILDGVTFSQGYASNWRGGGQSMQLPG